MTVAIDGRSHDLISLPRAAAEEAWCDVAASAWEARRDIGRAYQASRSGESPTPRLIAADGRLLRLHNYARRRAAEAAGITFIAPGQESLWDGCGPTGRAG
jgi:hypothetical protein